MTAAPARVVARHEVLRTALENRDGVPARIVPPEVPPEVPVTDLRGLLADEQQARPARARDADICRSAAPSSSDGELPLQATFGDGSAPRATAGRGRPVRPVTASGPPRR
ncbi:hypothetical protein HS041_13170 [Planomonospora sp. ID67723]|uniref:hypothetical protein n=1 Tax=Planomonospora sp. ID67723 TaxID=2738134 RepID=UPI0018C3F303|nr:hypothetical protein [Planomonospora sp. ID67723]MBG0828720.1 hypothetical protein [Planomonospora sp. ID67723]